MIRLQKMLTAYKLAKFLINKSKELKHKNIYVSKYTEIKNKILIDVNLVTEKGAKLEIIGNIISNFSNKI